MGLLFIVLKTIKYLASDAQVNGLSSSQGLNGHTDLVLVCVTGNVNTVVQPTDSRHP